METSNWSQKTEFCLPVDGGWDGGRKKEQERRKKGNTETSETIVGELYVYYFLVKVSQ